MTRRSSQNAAVARCERSYVENNQMNQTALVSESYEGRHEKAGDAHGRNRNHDSRARAKLGALAAGGAIGLGAAAVFAATPGLPFTETFDDATLNDTALTTADWGVTTPGMLTFPMGAALTDPFGASTAGEDFGGTPQITRSLAFGDMNGDGWIDVVQGGDGLNGVYLNDAAGNFTTRIDLPGTTANTRGIAVGDVDGDGDLDIVAGILNMHAPRLYLNSGDGAQYTASDIGNQSRPTDSIALADFNGDGLLDVAIGNHDKFFNYVYLNTGDPSAPFSTTDGGLRVANRSNDTQSLLAGDVDNDGDMDLVELNQNQGDTYYVNDGKATFTAHNLGAETDNTQSGALGDFNGDGFLDVFVGNFPKPGETEAQSKVYLNTGNPADPFGAVTPILIGSPNNPANVHGASVADIDNDGDIDILAATAGMGEASATTRFTNFVLVNDGTGASWTVVPIGADAEVTNSIVAADVDGDNDLDIVAGDEGRDAANTAFALADRLYRNTGQASATQARQLVAHARSLRVDNASTAITSVSLAIDPASLGAHNRADFWVSSNGGANWLHINPNSAPATFPQPVSGQDLRWRVDLSSLSPASDVGAAALAIDTLTLSTDAPAFTSAPVTTVTAGAAYAYNVTATDPNGDAITFTTPSTLPAWLTLTDNGGGAATLAGTPAETDVGNVQIELDASAGTHTTKQSFVLSVASANTAPSFTSTPPASAAVDAVFTYPVVASDPNPGDTLTLTAPTVPAWLTLTDNGDGTGTLTGTPGATDAGDATVQLVATDAGGATATQDFTISVVAGNAAPSFTSTPITAATDGQAYSYGVVASDPNTSDTVTLSAPTLPAWLTLTDNGDGTGTLAGTPATGDVGDVAVQLQAVDAAGAAATQDFTITVAAATGGTNNAPSFTSTAGTAATAGTAYSYTITTTDPDAADTRTITATSTLPAWLKLTDNGDGSATLAGTPAAGDVGNVPVTLQVADAAGATATQDFTVVVAAAGGGGGSTTPPPSSGGGGGGGSAGFGELAALLLLSGLRGRVRRGVMRRMMRGFLLLRRG
jgi:hypothetical protein